jgi:cobalt-zinc-cadmium efflux system membrane fusion protein
MNKPVLLLLSLLCVLPQRCSQDGSERPAAPVATPTERTATTTHSQSPELVCLSDESRDLVGIETEKVTPRACRSVFQAMGRVLAPQPQTAIVSYAFPGRVAEVHVKVGDWVEKGQGLVTLESQNVGDAKCDFYKAAAACELAKANFEREQRLSEAGIGVKKNFVAAETELKLAQANVEAAEKKLHVLGFTEEQVKEAARTHQISPAITLYAPISGKVVAVKAVRGGMVEQAAEILRIIDLRSLWVDAEIYEKDLSKVKVGQKVEIRIPAYPGEQFAGQVTYIGDMVDDDTRTITVRTEVANGDCRLKPGMFADVAILLNGSDPVLTVPVAAVLEQGRRQIVFVKEKDGYQRREVETALLEDGRRQVLKGLKAGEEVVAQGNHQLKSILERESLEAAHSH